MCRPSKCRNLFLVEARVRGGDKLAPLAEQADALADHILAKAKQVTLHPVGRTL